MPTSIYCIASKTDAETIVESLKANGFADDEISMLARREPDEHVTFKDDTWSPEVAAAGAGGGALLGGSVGVLATIGAFAIPGVGPLIAAGPIMAALGGAALGGTLGGVTGLFVGAGIPENEVSQYEGKLNDGYVLLSLNSDDSARTRRIKEIFTKHGGEDISTLDNLST